MIGRYAGISAGNWPLDGSSADISGNGNNGAGSGCTSVNGKFGLAVSMDGAASYITLPNNASLKPTAFTIMAWYKGTHDTVFKGTIIQNWNLTSYKYYGYFLSVNADGTAVVYVAKGTGTTANTDYMSCTGTTTINDGNIWHLICGRYDGSTLDIFVDGKKDNSVSWTGLAYTTTQYPMMGVRQDISGSYQDYLEGSIDEVVLLPYALSDSDMRRQYAWAKGML